MSNLPAPASDTITTTTETLREIIARLDTEQAALAEQGDTATLADGLAALDTLTRDLRLLVANTKTSLTSLLEQVPGHRHIGDGYAIERTRTSSTVHFDSPALLRRIVNECVHLALEQLDEVTDRDTEVAGVVTGSILDGLSDTLPLTATGIGWRMGGERSDHVGVRGYLPDEEISEYRTVKRPGGWSVKITRNQ